MHRATAFWRPCLPAMIALGTLLLEAAAPTGANAKAEPAMRKDTKIIAAAYLEPTTRYDHGVLDDSIEWGAMRLALADGRAVLIRLPQTRVFEDIAPRVVQTPYGVRLAMVVESHLERGARLALYDGASLAAATPFIGRAHRWLAPVGAADLDGDGALEIAYVDRPHLARTLRIWRLVPSGRDAAEAGVKRGWSLEPVAALQGVSNHRIGWDFIAGGIRRCAGMGESGAVSANPPPEMIVASGDWRQVLTVRLRGGQLEARPLGPYSDPSSLEAALDCPG